MTRAHFVAIAAAAMTSALASGSAFAECHGLKVVGGEGTIVKKEVSIPGIPPFSRDNWNTDWAVSTNTNYDYYIANVTALDDADLKVKVYLKYPDETSDEIFDRGEVDFYEGETLEVAGYPRRTSQPYQVNIFVGGLDGVGEPYEAAVYGCYR